MNKYIKILGFTLLSTFVLGSNVSANSKYVTKKSKLTTYQGIKGKAYSDKNLKKHSFSLKKYKSTKLYSNKYILVKKDNTTKKYVYVHSKNNKLKGFTSSKNVKVYPTKKVNHKIVKNLDITSKERLMSYIKQCPDLLPEGQLLNLSKSSYTNYKNLLSKQFNINKYSSSPAFKDGHAFLYTDDKDLKAPLADAINNWNKAFGSNIFELGNVQDETLKVELVTKDNNDWDGMFSNNSILVNKNNFYNQKYNKQINQINGAKVDVNDLIDGKNAKSKEQKEFNNASDSPLDNKYWTGVIMHEMAHAMGLGHTPYANDIVFAESSEEQEQSKLPLKYTWSTLRANNEKIATMTNKLSQRDLNRARLAKNMGIW
ncbi:hypothetical protein [Apilactobacillus ozensis]|uniref:hypothetical protein n=1 Tax=Apilactobacillus ozensis TaxID=866801 RepID=UPI002009F1AF|nr:hypothetical protein [Apilactobacillus ozensis]MCK8606824.1 hypothetical protein [Apilactobacillus ozensis]